MSEVEADLQDVLHRLAESYAPNELRTWLFARHAMLNGERPIDLIPAGQMGRLLGVIETVEDANCI